MDKRYVKSVYRASEILDFIAERKHVTLAEVSRELGIPKSTAHEIIYTLTAVGILEKEEKTGEYSLGIKLIELGNHAQQNLEIRRIATPIMRELNEELDETVHLTVLDDDEVLYVECFESSKRLRTYSVIGIRAPLYCTAVGKAILAGIDEGEVDRVIERRGLKAFTRNTITDRDKLIEELKRTRKRGYSVDNVEHEEGVRCVGAPIRDISGRVVASISVSGPTQRITEDKIPEIGRIVREKAERISRLLGYR